MESLKYSDARSPIAARIIRRRHAGTPTLNSSFPAPSGARRHLAPALKKSLKSDGGIHGGTPTYIQSH